MPGVPTGRACDACRKQKKKCDEQIPSCSRCIRLGLTCIGSGQRRYKFQAQQYFSTVRKTKRQDPASIGKLSQTEVKDYISTSLFPIPVLSPSNSVTSLTSRYIYAIKLSPDLRHSLAWAYGLFMFEVPRRMNTNESLDSAVYALVCAHSDLCTRQQVSVEALTSYARALTILRQCLSDPVKASSSETLCAVMLLLICQGINGPENRRRSGHCEGAAQILKARSSMKPRNEFEQQLLLSLRGCVLFEGLLNPRIDLTPEEWTSLVGNDLDEKLPEGKLMRSLARMPVLIRRRRTESGTKEVLSLRAEAKLLYETCKTTLDEIRANWMVHEESLNTKNDLSASILHAYYQRMYGISLSIVTIINCVYRAFAAAADQQQLCLDAAHFAKEMFQLAQLATRYRPLGAAYMMIALSSTWLAATNEKDKLSAEILLKDYGQDFPMRSTSISMRDLNWMAQQLESLRLSDG